MDAAAPSVTGPVPAHSEAVEVIKHPDDVVATVVPPATATNRGEGGSVTLPASHTHTPIAGAGAALSSDELTHAVTEAEVLGQLRRLPWQSSPGPDSVVPYSTWKATPSAPRVLAAIFTTCLTNCKLPTSWKKSDTQAWRGVGSQELETLLTPAHHL